MVIMFCGHADFQKNERLEFELISVLDKCIEKESCELIFGGYGNFDLFAFHCGLKLKQLNKKTKLTLVIPYVDAKHLPLSLKSQMGLYDEIVYPSQENVPYRYAILMRNKWMVERADFVIAFIDHGWGGAYQTYLYAKKKMKPILNLAETDSVFF
ncbi:MAG: hypothetical protein E7666_07510 [Ruminococcaceae bacterium]|nr:hypothetical protein [Oscillospiraceae bacterium]